MFRSIFVHAKNSINLSPLSSGFCTKAPLGRRREINEVKIIGTVISDSFTLASGTKLVTVKTIDSALKYANHNIHIRTQSDLLAGQRIVISGPLKSNPVRTNDGKTITSTVVKATNMYVLENECGSTENSGDVNQVQLLSSVASEIISNDKSTSFAVATHFTRRKSDSAEETSGTHFHRVFVYDQALRNYVANKLTKSDRIMVTGKIGHMTYTAEDGKKLYSGFVIADNIYKVARRNIEERDVNQNLS